MSLHLFPTPVECKNCGTVVDDPSADHCPNCGKLLMERRTPSRLAGVERKYENLRLLLGFVRFLGVITALVGLLIFVFTDDSFALVARLLTLLGTLLVGTGLFVIAALIEMVADLEENTRASFRIQQAIHEELRRNRDSSE
ncbi:MAG TPA: hypothetical protein VMN39_02690 [Longimicrobiaceae bacterium]|nr:hypothetical protein [Longimicrobiaceae bacterium]